MHQYYYFVDFVRDSKILEYGVAFAFIGLFAIFYKLMIRPEAQPAAAESFVSKALERIKGLLLPEGLAYHRGHTWARPESPQLAAVGLDDFAAKLLGPVQRVTLPAVGATVKQGEKAWTLTVDGKAVDMVSPVDGRVVAVNPNAARALTDDPYGQGWLLKIESPKMGVNWKNLLTGLLAKVWTEQSVDALFARANTQLGAVAADGGAPMSGMAKNIDAEHWDEIAREFFLTNE